MEQNKLNYWESRKINIGHYEDRQFGFSYTVSINNFEKVGEISHSEEVEVSNDLSIEEFKELQKKLVSRVTNVLDNRERSIRLNVSKLEMDDVLDHMEKLEAMNIKVSDEIKDKLNKSKIKKLNNRKKLTDDFED